jgi:asparagine synthetase B (glutamine-hydrolysing)
VLAGARPEEQWARVNTVFDAAARRRLLARPGAGAGATGSPSDLAPGGGARVADDAGWLPAVCGRESGDPVERMLMFDLVGYLPEDNLMKVDRATMAHGLEARSPFLARELVELVLSLPAARRAGGWLVSKPLLRRALAGVLPPDVCSRPKQAFDLPVGAWLASDLAALVSRVLDPAYLRAQGVFDPDAVRSVRAGTGAVGAPPRSRLSDRERARRLWTLVAFQLWYLVFLEDADARARVLAGLPGA